jgi:hypothetical protein
VIVDDFDLVRIAVSPFKTDSPLVIYADAPKPFPVASERLQPISRRRIEILNPRSPVNLAQFTECNPLKRLKSPTVTVPEDLFGFSVCERPDHA